MYVCRCRTVILCPFARMYVVLERQKMCALCFTIARSALYGPIYSPKWSQLLFQMVNKWLIYDVLRSTFCSTRVKSAMGGRKIFTSSRYSHGIVIGIVQSRKESKKVIVHLGKPVHALGANRTLGTFGAWPLGSLAEYSGNWHYMDSAWTTSASVSSLAPDRL